MVVLAPWGVVKELEAAGAFLMEVKGGGGMALRSCSSFEVSDPSAETKISGLFIWAGMDEGSTAGEDSQHPLVFV